MKVAFVHYHLKPGGVTTVIRQQVEAIRKFGGEALVFADAPSPSSFPAETVPIPGLGYSRGSETAPPGESVAEDIAAAVTKRWPEGCDVVHVHNPTLAKNSRFPDILKALQEKGLRLLLQIHDFAEDGRPDAYTTAPYPDNCHYGVINSRDYRILLKAGLKKEGLHLLPNMVSPIEADSNAVAKAPFVLYPVRAIRRKNIGEALLLSLFFKTGFHLAITLPPNSPADMVAYEDWKLFSKSRHLPVRFEAGLQDDFSSLAAAAHCFVTTSITEGFGFSFLEPWTAGKSLRGRKLDICSDFESRGIELEDLYPRLLVPLDWLDRSGYLDAWRNALERASRRFAFVIPPDVISEAETQLAGSIEVDFGLLSEKYQKEVLQRLVEDPANMTVLKRLNPFLEDLMDPPVPRNRIHRNREVVLAHYNADEYQETLQHIYKRVTDEIVRHGIRKEVLLSSFFNPNRLSLLKWGRYETRS